jgi:hypothetical protein
MQTQYEDGRKVDVLKPGEILAVRTVLEAESSHVGGHLFGHVIY